MTSLGPYTEISTPSRLTKVVPFKVEVNSILALLEKEPDFSMFLHLVRLAGLAGFFANPPPTTSTTSGFTVFVSSDRLIKGLIDEKVWRNLTIATARAIVHASTIPYKLTADLLMGSPGRIYPSLNRDAPLLITNTYMNDLNARITTVNGTSPIVVYDINRSNGVVHVIDGLITPKTAPLL